MIKHEFISYDSVYMPGKNWRSHRCRLSEELSGFDIQNLLGQMISMDGEPRLCRGVSVLDRTYRVDTDSYPAGTRVQIAVSYNEEGQNVDV